MHEVRASTTSHQRQTPGACRRVTRRRFIEVFGGCLPARHGRDRTDKPRRQRRRQNGSNVSLVPRAPVSKRSEVPMCGIVGYAGRRRRQADHPRRPAASRVPRLRLGGHRPAGRSAASTMVRSVGKLDALDRGRRQRRLAGGRGHRPHALGHARPPQHDNAHPHVDARPHRDRPQRHHRELHGAARRARGARARALLRDRRRDRRPPHRGAASPAASPTRCAPPCRGCDGNYAFCAVSADEPQIIVAHPHRPAGRRPRRRRDASSPRRSPRCSPTPGA